MSDASSPLRRSSLAVRRSFPLYARIMIWFVLNVLLVAAGAFWLLRSQFGLDNSWLLTRESRVRWQFLVENLRRDVEETSPSEWNELLIKLGEAEGMTFALADGLGRQVAGELAPWPPEIQQRVAPGFGRGGLRGPAPREPRGPREPDMAPPPPGRGPEPDRPARGRWLRPPPLREFRVEALRAGHPAHYWAMAWLPGEGLSRASGPAMGRPLVLVGRTDRLGMTDLLFNPRPWWLGGLAFLTASALLWWPLVRGATRALARMRDATVRIAQGDFAVRVEETRRDEIGELGSAVNAMTQQLEDYVRGQKRFLGDIAHELCSPLARLEMGLGVLEQRAPESLQSRLSEARDEVREMSALVNELLSFSKSTLTPHPAPEPVFVGELLRAALARELPAAAPGTVQWQVAEDLQALAVPALVTRAFGNVIRNAARHAGPLEPSRPLGISAWRRPGSDGRNQVVVTFADHGPGVPEAELTKLFEPFYRLDPARTRETGGTGLGLAIVKSCVQASGGTVTARARPDGPGLVVEICFPAAGSSEASRPPTS